jgi:hypothetical protein
MRMASRIDEARFELTRLGVNVDDLVILFLGDNEMALGEYGNRAADPRPSLLEKLPPVIQLTNPKRLARLQMMDRTTGAIATDLRLSDFDFVTSGIIEFRHNGGFALSWIDEDSQVKYMSALAGFLESKKVSSAQEAGIIIPSIVPTPLRK